MSSAYRSLHIDTSKKKLEFEGFPMPADFPTFCHHTHIRQYFEDIVDHFGLRDAIRFETPVRRAERTEQGGWRITLDDEVRHYDHLVVATGHHWDPKWPDFPGRFDGPAIHSHQYIDPFDPLDLKGKRALVVGIGNSAVDIAFAQAIPSVIGFVQDQAAWAAAYLAGEYALPTPDGMEAAIQKDEARMMGHYVKSTRHTMQVDHVLYAHDLAKEWKRGRKRARRTKQRVASSQ